MNSEESSHGKESQHRVPLGVARADTDQTVPASWGSPSLIFIHTLSEGH